jgi:hypothetical protein
MNLRDLTALFRNEVDDATEPFLWSDEEAIDFANDAEGEACRRARLLVDSSTAEICVVEVLAAGGGLVTLDPRIMFVRRARIEGARPLARMNMQDMETDNPYWQNAPAGTPRMFITDYQTGKLLLWPAPDEDDVLLLTVVRTPLEDMNDDEDSPEIAPRFHRSLRYWMMFRAYSKQDSQANDPKKSADALALFEQEFGKKSSAIDETWIEREQSYMDGTF